jgi:lysophospholipase L1-like esterase
MVNKLLIKCIECEYQFDKKLVGKRHDQDDSIFLCVACCIGKRLKVLEDKVIKLESNRQEISELKDDFAEVKAAIADFHVELKPRGSTLAGKQTRKVDVATDEEFSECSQILLVDLPPETKPKVVNPLLSTKKEEILVIGNSLVKNVSNSCGKASVITIPGGGIEDIEKHMRRDLPENIIVHIGANDISRHWNRSEELLGKIRRVLETLKEKKKSIVISGIIPRPGKGSFWHNVALSLDMRVEALCKNLGFVFVDNWKSFYGQQGNHMSDGIHLNKTGTSKLEASFSCALKQLKN